MNFNTKPFFLFIIIVLPFFQLSSPSNISLTNKTILESIKDDKPDLDSNQVDLNVNNNIYLPKPENGNLLINDGVLLKNNKIDRVTTNYSLNDEEKFWVQDIYNASNAVDSDGDGRTFNDGDWDEAMYEITAIAVNITENAVIFVDNAVVNTLLVNTAVDLAQEFENKIAPKVNQFGLPSDIDSNQKIIILIFEFREASSSVGVSGFFWALHQFQKSNDPENITFYSEEKEIVHINSKTLIRGVDQAAPTLAHEYFHLIHFNIDQEEDIWLEEGLATLTELIASYKDGFIVYLQNSGLNGYFQSSFDTSLTYFSLDLKSYGITFLFLLYLYQRYGFELIKDIVNSNLKGIESIRVQILNNYNNLSFETVYNDWVITNFVNDITNDLYSYDNFTFKISASEYDETTLQIIPSQLISEQINYWSNQFYTLPENNNIPYKINFMPEIESDYTQYQVSIITRYDNGTWNVSKTELYKQQSGSITIQDKGSFETKYLIISSMTGQSSGWSTTDNIPSGKFHLFLDPIEIDYNFISLDLTAYRTSFEMQLKSLEGESITESVVSNIDLLVYDWETQTQVTSNGVILAYNNVTQTWYISIEEGSVEKGQYYLLIKMNLVNDQQIQLYSPTFLIEDVSVSLSISNNSTSSFDQQPIDLGVSFTESILLLSGSLILINHIRKKED